MKYLQTICIIISAGFLFTSCEKVIDLDLPDGEKLLYIDAWINEPGTQSIKLLRAVNYQDPSESAAVADATIKVTDLTANKVYDFTFENGAYNFTPDAGESIGVVDHRYKLDISYNGESFVAEDILPRVTKIDSLILKYKEGSGDFEKQGYYAEFYARDVAGAIDYYWIRTFRNGVRNSFLNDMLSIDGSFYPEISDGFVFIPPFREGVTSGEKPYQKGDEVTVMIRSVSKNSYIFMEQSLKQIENGGLFSEVLQNVPANITNINTGSNSRIYGWFGTVGETSDSITVN